MNIYFGSAHMQTLCDLEKIATKHNCVIHFGVDQHNSDDIDVESDFSCSPEVAQELDEKGHFDCHEMKYEATTIWFELLDNNSNTLHQLQYIDGYERAEYILNTFEELSDRTEEFLDDVSGDSGNYNPYDDSHIYTLYRSFGETKVTGFPGQERPSVYREGMALKFFGDLVCDYLSEKRIERVY